MAAPAAAETQPDTIAPVITATRDRLPNASGWNRTDVTVTWTCSDNSPDPVLSEETFTFTGEGAALEHTVSCSDSSGNTAYDTQTVSIDRTAPLSSIDPYVGGDVRGGATDALSGITSTSIDWKVVGTISQSALCTSGCGTGNVRWRATPPRPYPNVYRIAVRSRDAAGNVGPAATATIVVIGT